MKEINIFEYAAKNKLRFPFRGSIAAEDLYDLTPQNLDSIYKLLMREVKASNEESLLTDLSVEDVQLQVKIDIVKHIVAEKLANIEKAKNAAAAKMQADKIRSIIAKKQDAALENLSTDELKKMLEGIENH